MVLEAQKGFGEGLAWGQEALTAASVGLWVLEHDTGRGLTRLLTNAITRRLLGVPDDITPEECATFWRSRVDSRDMDSIWKKFEDFKNHDDMCEMRYGYNHPQWGPIHVRSGGRRVSEDGQQVLRIAGFHQDISELHAAHQALRESLSRLSLACRLGWLGVFELGRRKGKLEFTCNEVFYEQFGLREGANAEERLAAVEKCILPEDRRRWRSLCRSEGWTVGFQEHVELRVNHPWRGLCWFAVACEVVGTPEEPRIAGYVSDVTKHRQHERMLREAKESAEAANAAKSIFLANMSHEIRTPMNGIIGLTHLALQSNPSDEQKNYLQKIRTSATNLLAIINDILDLSKIEANKMVLENTNYPLEDVLEFVHTSLRFPLEQKGLEYVCSVGDEVPHKLWGDSLRLKQVLLNLMSNAVKFTAEGKIALSIDREIAGDTDNLHFRIADTGMGISREYQQHLFDPYTQANASISRRFGGTGLGLSICKRIAELMHGVLWCESELGKGSTFHLCIPCMPARNVYCPAEHSAALPEPLEGAEVCSILVAEDNEINVEVLRAMLRQLGFECDIAPNGKEALRMAMETPYDIVLMDVNMPVMDGLAATREIRRKLAQNDDKKSLPIIALTTATLPDNVAEIINAGMNDHIGKPFSMEVLRKKLASWLNLR